MRDDFDTVISEDYSDLKRDSMYSVIRWTLETLQNVYPKAKIFWATPLWTTFNTQTLLEEKQFIIKKMCNYMGVTVIDSFYNSGINKFNADNVYGGLHPNPDGKDIVSTYASAQVKSGFGGLI